MEGESQTSGKLQWGIKKKIVGQTADWTEKQLRRHEALRQRNFERAKSVMEKRAVLNLQRREHFQSLLRSKISGKIAPQSSSVQIILKKYDNLHLDSPHEKRDFTPLCTEVRPHSMKELSAYQPTPDIPYRLSCRSASDSVSRKQEPKPRDDTWIEKHNEQKWVKPIGSIPSKTHRQFVLVQFRPSRPEVPKPTPFERRLLEARFPNYEAWYGRKWQASQVQKPREIRGWHTSSPADENAPGYPV
uniref:Uncharacterized protein LOC117351064 n=1 Tax=Geotrypetes seraphini TaxID=260995 RepID=A0A6P8PJH6_GEOSA|nr:uncharacterized protein LOC117351064 [Geotrypetes seraphini]